MGWIIGFVAEASFKRGVGSVEVKMARIKNDGMTYENEANTVNKSGE